MVVFGCGAVWGIVVVVGFAGWRTQVVVVGYRRDLVREFELLTMVYALCTSGLEGLGGKHRLEEGEHNDAEPLAAQTQRVESTVRVAGDGLGLAHKR